MITGDTLAGIGWLAVDTKEEACRYVLLKEVAQTNSISLWREYGKDILRYIELDKPSEVVITLGNDKYRLGHVSANCKAPICQGFGYPFFNAEYTELSISAPSSSRITVYYANPAISCPIGVYAMHILPLDGYPRTIVTSLGMANMDVSPPK
jgi:hypothetical protein